eukprot:GHUV01001781.1.p1 GENE.GHUV01001781.1~~GHUV01001781.1.p1  ORF type:complete len:629 (+),score=241.08 GHUV01001781.1:810-2696(+)
MGNTSSIPERIYRAAKSNDLNELQGLCRDMRLNGSLDIATKRQWLNWTDVEGRTALHWACQKNYLQTVQILLDEGADIHAIAPKRANGGSPLAEAVVGKHEALVELLLRYGADPFTENSAGKTPLDLALELRAQNIIRSFERYALFAGYVNMKVLQMKGFSHAAKDRWVVISPRFTPPSQRGGAVGVVRVMMLVYRNAAEAEPRTKLWLDGASIFRSGHEAVLRLHPNHEQPRNAYTKYDNGWMLFFKQATTSFSSPAAAAAAATAGVSGAGLNNNAGGGAAATFAAFMAVCHRPLEHLHAQQQIRALAPGATGQLQDMSNFGAHTANPFAIAPAAYNPWQQQQAARPQLVAGAGSSNPSSPQYANSAPGAYPSFGQQQQLYNQSGLQVEPAGAPPVAAQQQDRPAAGAISVGESALVAAPGESDEDFARRLASMYGGSQHGSGTGLAARAGSGYSPAPTTRASSMAAPQPLEGPGFEGRQTGSDSSGESAPSAPALGQGMQQLRPPWPQPSENPFRPAAGADGNPFRPASAGQAAAAPAGGAVSAIQAALGAGPGSAGVTGGSAGSGSAEGSDAELCVICLVNPREVGFLHGASVHKCVCRDCAELIHPGSACPMCRQTIERVIGVY